MRKAKWLIVLLAFMLAASFALAKGEKEGGAGKP